MFPFCPIPVLRRSIVLVALLGLAIMEGCGGQSSNAAPAPPLAVAPVIVTQPSNVTVTVPQPASFSVVATGTAPLHYQWKLNATLVGTDSATFSLASTSAPDGGWYSVIVSNAAGSVESNSALLIVFPTPVAPTFRYQPASQSVVAPATATFYADVIGAPSPTVQWQRSNDSGVTWTDLAGATLFGYTTAATALTDTGSQFRAVATSSAGTVISNAATLTVNLAPPVILTQPTSVTVTAPQSATFSVVASGTGPLHYQWKKLAGNVGTDAPTFSLASTSSIDSSTYSVIVSNAAGSVWSDWVSLTVIIPRTAPVFTTQPTNLTLTVGQNGQFVVAVSGSPTPGTSTFPLDWQTSLNNGPWVSAGVSGPTYDVIAASLADTGRQYRAVTSNDVGTTYSNPATLTVTAVPPSGLIYTAGTAAYTKGVAITPNTPSSGGGAVVSYSVSPSLPAGLSLSTSTGVISGTPTAITASASYTVTATNSGGSTTASLSLAVNDLPPTGLSYAFPTSTYTVGTAIAANAPSQGGGVVTLYSVSPALPAGLNLNASTGVVSGLPSIPAAAAVYTITAANSGGSITYSLSITVNPAVAGKAWYSATTLSLDNPGDAMQPQLAFGGAGLATAVWDQSYGTGYGVWARSFTPATGWAPAVRLEANTIESAVAPRVAMDTAGNALVVWLQRDGTYYSIWANHFTVGSGWDGTVQLDGGGLGSMADLRVAMDAAGHGVAVWIQQGPLTWPVHAAQYQPGAGWSSAVEVMGDAGWIDLALNTSGAGMLVVSAADVVGTTAFSMWGIPFSTATGWGAAARLQNDSAGGWDVVPSVAVDPSGAAVAVWQRYDKATGIFSIRSNRFPPSGPWGTAEFIETSTVGSAADPRIALDANGNGIAVWQQADAGSGAHLQIWSNRFTLGSGWGTAGLLENFRAYDIYPAQYPQVAFDPTGNAFALWLDSGGDIQGVGYTLGTGWGTQRAMGPSTIYAPGAPQIAFDGDGNAFAIWYQVVQPANALHYAVWVSRYE
jgi:hypothetical protein